MLIDSAIGIYMLWGIVKFIWSVIYKLVYWVILFGVIIGGIIPFGTNVIIKNSFQFITQTVITVIL